MQSRRGNEAEERLVLRLLDEAGRVAKQDVGRVAVALDHGAIVVPRRIHVGVAEVVGQLADSAAAVVECLVESAVHRAERKAVAKVPFPEDCRPIARPAQVVRERCLMNVEDGHSADRVVNPIAKGVTAGHELGPAGRAERRGVEIPEVDGLGGKAIDVGSLNLGVPVNTQFVIALVVSQDKQHVRPGGSPGTRRVQRDGETRCDQHRKRTNASSKSNPWRRPVACPGTGGR